MTKTKATSQAKKPRATELKLSHAKTKFDKGEKFETYTLVDGKVIKFNTFFLDGKINDLLNELHEKVVEANEKEIDFFSSDDNFMHFLYFLMIKYFTHFQKEISNDFETQITQMEWLVGSGYYDEIVNEVLPADEADKIMKKFADNAVKGYVLDILEQETKEKAEALVDNKEILSNIKK